MGDYTVSASEMKMICAGQPTPVRLSWPEAAINCKLLDEITS